LGFSVSTDFVPSNLPERRAQWYLCIPLPKLSKYNSLQRAKSHFRDIFAPIEFSLCLFPSDLVLDPPPFYLIAQFSFDEDLCGITGTPSDTPPGQSSQPVDRRCYSNVNIHFSFADYDFSASSIFPRFSGSNFPLHGFRVFPGQWVFLKNECQGEIACFAFGTEELCLFWSKIFRMNPRFRVDGRFLYEEVLLLIGREISWVLGCRVL